MLIDFDYTTGRSLLPPPGSQPALVVPLDYEDVVPREPARHSWPVMMAEFDAGLPTMQAFLARLAPFMSLLDVPADKVDEVTPYWRNPYFSGVDPRVLYGFIRAYRPKRIIEIGSGNSTKFMRLAIAQGGTATTICSIDPRPRTEIAPLVDQQILSGVQAVETSVFATLEENDLLFFDGSHLAFHGSDVPHFFLDVLPAVAPGVFVHVHDIYLPYEYTPACDRLHYNEQYVLAAFLQGNPSWEVVSPNWYLSQKGLLGEGASFWMRRVS